jgi:hypothetical protein
VASASVQHVQLESMTNSLEPNHSKPHDKYVGPQQLAGVCLTIGILFGVLTRAIEDVQFRSNNSTRKKIW